MERLDKLATEARNPRSAHIDELKTLELVRLINAEDCAVAPAVGQALGRRPAEISFALCGQCYSSIVMAM